MTKNTVELKVPIVGMNSASCAARVERALSQVPGVSSTSVNLGGNFAEVSFVIGEVDTFDLAGATNQAGFEVPDETLILSISGMTCLACALRVEGALADVAGVLAANVNLTTNEAAVTFIPGTLGLPDLATAIARCGYQAWEKDDC